MMTMNKRYTMLKVRNMLCWMYALLSLANDRDFNTQTHPHTPTFIHLHSHLYSFSFIFVFEVYIPITFLSHIFFVAAEYFELNTKCSRTHICAKKCMRNWVELNIWPVYFAKLYTHSSTTLIFVYLLYHNCSYGSFSLPFLTCLIVNAILHSFGAFRFALKI